MIARAGAADSEFAAPVMRSLGAGAQTVKYLPRPFCSVPPAMPFIQTDGIQIRCASPPDCGGFLPVPACDIIWINPIRACIFTGS